MDNWLNYHMEFLMINILVMRSLMRRIFEMFYHIVMSWSEFDMGLDDLMMFSVRVVLVMNHMVWGFMMLDMLSKTMLL